MPIASWHWRCQGRYNIALDGTLLHLHREETEQDQLLSLVSVPNVQQVLFNSECRATGSHVPLFRWSRRTLSPPHRGQIAMGLAKCHMTPMLKQSKGTYIDSEIRRDNPLWVGQFSRLLGLFISVRHCSRP